MKGPGPGRLAGWGAAGLAAGLVTLASCSAPSGAPPGTLLPTTSASATSVSTVPPRPAVYSAYGVAVRASFPGVPSKAVDPPTLAPLFPAHTAVTAWSLGNVGELQIHSYELLLASFPPGSTPADIYAFLTRYAGKPNTTRYGRPALRTLTLIPLSGGNRYSGITSFSTGLVLVMAVAYEDAAAPVAAWLASVRLVA